MGEVRLEATGGVPRDVFGRHVDWAARAMSMADGGHICVTRPIYADAFSWIRQMQKNGQTWDLVLCDPPKFVDSRDVEFEAAK